MGSIVRSLKSTLSQPIWEKFSHYQTMMNGLRPIAVRTCNICHFKGYFRGFGRPLRLDAKCPKCASLERHRLLMLAIERGEIEAFNRADSVVLHFAAEAILETIFRKRFSDYTTADLFAKSDIQLDMENINLEDESVDIVIANHVLEHVNDKKAARELSRILRPDGLLVCQVPIVEGWATTYENEDITDAEGRQLHFGQNDHVRFYGRDFRDRISSGGFNLVKEVTSEGIDVVDYSLLRGEKVFIFQKASRPQ